MMTLSGVRSSCDMVERNSDFSSLARRRSATRRTLLSAIATCCAMPAKRSRPRSEKRGATHARAGQQEAHHRAAAAQRRAEQRARPPALQQPVAGRIAGGVTEDDVALVQQAVEQGERPGSELDVAQGGNVVRHRAGAADDDKGVALRIAQHDDAPGRVQRAAGDTRDAVEHVIGVERVVDLLGDRHQALADRRFLLAPRGFAVEREAVQVEIVGPEQRDGAGRRRDEQQVRARHLGRRLVGKDRSTGEEGRGDHDGLPAHSPRQQQRGAGDQADSPHHGELGRQARHGAVGVQQDRQGAPAGHVERLQPAASHQRPAPDQQRYERAGLRGRTSTERRASDRGRRRPRRRPTGRATPCTMPQPGAVARRSADRSRSDRRRRGSDRRTRRRQTASSGPASRLPCALTRRLTPLESARRRADVFCHRRGARPTNSLVQPGSTVDSRAFSVQESILARKRTGQGRKLSTLNCRPSTGTPEQNSRAKPLSPPYTRLVFQVPRRYQANISSDSKTIETNMPIHTPSMP